MKSFNYLGVKFDENINFKYCNKTRSEAASRALDGIVLKCKQYSDVGYNTYFICLIILNACSRLQDHDSDIRWNSNINVCDIITVLAMIYYQGVHNLTPHIIAMQHISP